MIRKDILLFIALIIPPFMIGIDLLSIGVALAPMAKAFQVKLGLLQWLITAFAIGNASLLVASGHISDVFGRKKILLLGLLLFTVSSLLIAVLNNIYLEIIARFLQGASGGVMVTSAIATIMTILPDEKKQHWIGAMVGAAGLGMALGPMIGGLLVHYISWRAIFFINVPIGLFAIYCALTTVPFMNRHEDISLDLAGIVFVCLFLVGLTLLTSQTHVWGVLSVYSIITVLVCFSSAILLAVLEPRHSSPVLRFSIFTAKGFLTGNVLGFCIYAGLTSYLLIWGIYFEKLYNASAVMVAMYLLPIGILMFLCSVLSSVITKYLTKLQCARWGCLFCCLSAFSLAVSGVNTAYIYFFFSFAFYGLGFYLVNSVTIPLAIAHVDQKYIGIGSGIAMMLRWFGGAMGSAVSALIFELSAKKNLVGHVHASQLYQAVVGHNNLAKIISNHGHFMALQNYYYEVLNKSMSYSMYFIALLLLLAFVVSVTFLKKTNYA